jgi:hypothetical protein
MPVTDSLEHTREWLTTMAAIMSDLCCAQLDERHWQKIEARLGVSFRVAHDANSPRRQTRHDVVEENLHADQETMMRMRMMMHEDEEDTRPDRREQGGVLSHPQRSTVAPHPTTSAQTRMMPHERKSRPSLMTHPITFEYLQSLQIENQKDVLHDIVQDAIAEAKIYQSLLDAIHVWETKNVPFELVSILFSRTSYYI